MDENIEILTPSSNPKYLKIVLITTVLLMPIMGLIFYQGYSNNQLMEMFLSIYGVIALSVATSIMYKQLNNPDKLIINEKGIIYEFLNIKFRIGWEDIENVKFDGTKVIYIKANSPEKIAANSLIMQEKPLARTQFNPYTKQLVKKSFSFKNPWVKNTEDLAKLLKESNEQNGYTIAIPFLESSEIAEKIYNQIHQKHINFQPQYESPFLSAQTNEANADEFTKSKQREIKYE
ncbi:MAG: hypothetical protein WAQ98_28700 [Blastocatellia bacterium]